MIDVKGIPDVDIGDEVVIFSHQDGAMSYLKGAEICDFNMNGLQTAVTRRVQKVYSENGKEVVYRDYFFDKEADF